MKINLIVFLLLIDASKAFDRVEYVIQTIRERRIYHILIRIIMDINENIQITWNQLMIQTCDIANGGKQG